MAPKSPKKNMMEETIADMAKQLKTLTTTIQGNNTRMDSLEMLIKGLSAENKDLKKELVARDEEIFDLKSRINNMDQRHRSWSTRIFNIPLSKEEEGDNFQVMQAVYNNALLPILRGAVASKILSTVPTCEQVLETAHVLPGAADKPKPIIARFFSRNIRAIVLISSVQTFVVSGPLSPPPPTVKPPPPPTSVGLQVCALNTPTAVTPPLQ